MTPESFSREYIASLSAVLSRFDHEAFSGIVAVLLSAYNDGRRIFVMGNGGSAAAASHLACDINKGTCQGLEKRFRMMALTDNIPTMLAYANDVAYESIFVEQLKNFFEPGDVVFGISGSGNSENVLACIRHANDNQGVTIGVSGFSGGKLSALAGHSLVIPVHDMQQVEDGHMIVIHMLMQYLYRELNGNFPGWVCS